MEEEERRIAKENTLNMLRIDSKVFSGGISPRALELGPDLVAVREYGLMRRVDRDEASRRKLALENARARTGVKAQGPRIIDSLSDEVEHLRKDLEFLRKDLGVRSAFSSRERNREYFSRVKSARSGEASG